MARIIDHGLAGPDDPIYSEGIRIFSIRKPNPPKPERNPHEPNPHPPPSPHHRHRNLKGKLP